LFKVLECTILNTVYDVQSILVVAFEFTSAAHGFKVKRLCGSRGQKGWTALHK